MTALSESIHLPIPDRSPRRVARFWRLFGGLFVVATLATVAAVAGTRLRPGYGCLQYSESEASLYTLADVHTWRIESAGLTIPPHPPISGLRRPSPDSRYIAYLDATGADQQLSIAERSSGRIVFFKKAAWLDFGWSPDGTHMAYVWRDDPNDGQNSLHVVISLPDGSQERTAAFPFPNGAQGQAFSFDSWSADGAYLAVKPNSYTLYLISVADLRLLPDTLQTLDVHPVWSPVGHRFAYLNLEESGDPRLIIATPETGSIQSFDLPQNEFNVAISWSPDGRYLSTTYNGRGPAYTLRNVSAQDNYVKYDIFGIDGSAKVGINGEVANYPFPPTALWSADSRRWLFLQQQPGKPAYTNDLLVLGVEDKALKTLATAIARPDSGGSGELLDLVSLAHLGKANFLAVPLSQQDQVVVQLIDQDGKSSASLVSGADTVTRTVLSPDQKFIAVVAHVTNGGQQSARLIWARADGTGRQFISMDDARIIRWLDDGKSLLYVNGEGSEVSIEMLDVLTGNHHRLANGISPDALTSHWAAWELYPAPDGRRLLLTLDTNCYICGGTAPPGIVAAYLASWDGSQPHILESTLNRISEPVWSPDSALLAYMARDQNGTSTIEVFGTDGTHALHEYVGSFLKPDLAWTDCH